MIFQMRVPLIHQLITSLILFLLSISVYGNVRLPVLISDGMVLQRDTKINIWGWASPGEKVKVLFNNKTFRTVTDSRGNWKVTLAPMKAGWPYTMGVKGKNSVIIKDILIGDVWFCSGQSNMVLNMERVKEKYSDDIADANYPEIRNFFI